MPELSVKLFILNAPLPLLQNNPNGKLDTPRFLKVDPTENLLYECVFGMLGET